VKKKLLLLGFCLVLLVLLSEVVLRFFFAVPPIWREPQIRHLRSPLLSWVLPPGSRSYTIDAPVAVNSLGLRDNEFPAAKPAGEIRVLCLGDSFTFSLGVRFDDLYVQQLERMLQKSYPDRPFQVINSGVSGYNTRQELIYLLAEGLALEPDLITVGFYWNDIIDNEKPLPDPATPPRLLPGELAPGEPPHTLPSWLRDTLRKSLLLYQGVVRTKELIARFNPPQDRYTRYQKALIGGDHDFLAASWEATAERLHQIAAAAEQHGVPVILMVFPMEFQIRRDFPDLVCADRVREIWQPTGQPFIDLEEPYRRAIARGENPFLDYDMHPNRAGMRIAAELLFETIVQNDLLPLE